MDIPTSSNAEQKVKEGYSLYCLDPSLLLLPSSSSTSSTNHGVTGATTPCRNGYVHNSNCMGSWQKTDVSVPGYPLPYETPPELPLPASSSSSSMDMDTNDEYCYGGTSMYMDGFTWRGSVCVIYLFRSWVVTTPVQFVCAALGSILLGIIILKLKGG